MNLVCTPFGPIAYFEEDMDIRNTCVCNKKDCYEYLILDGALLVLDLDIFSNGVPILSFMTLDEYQ